MMDMRMKHKDEEVSSWKERITTWSLMLLYGFAFLLLMKGVFFILGLIHHGASLLFGWPTKY
jgi:hypothetical protein